MNASILIVGDEDFSTRLCKQVRGLSAMPLWQVVDAHAAKRLLESEIPEILFLQATQKENWELCRSVKQQRHLMGSYCILLDDRACPPEGAPVEALLRQTGLTITALEAGADAYLWVPRGICRATQGASTYINRLIQAHIRTAMRQLQAYRELSQTNDLLSAIALVDSLTRLGNRRAFDWELPRSVKTARDQAYDLSLLILDIDYFKRVNDQHGHLVGDQVLRLFAERLQHHMRFYETPFRYGGEEFVVLLQNTGLQEAERTAERLRSLIDNAPFAVEKELVLPITISIGVATLEAHDDPKGLQLMARADLNLLRAKSGGRNRVIIS